MSMDSNYLGYIEAHADVMRNRADGFYENKPCSVRYVFDADIVEMFVNPYRYFINQQENTTSEKRSWMFDWGLDLTPRPGGSKDDKTVMPELAMITAEYLLSGNLPGSDGIIYFTPWHHREVSNQCRHLINTLSRSNSQEIASGLEKTVNLYRSAIEKEDRDDWERSAKELMKHLSREESSEPYEQLCRLLAILRTRVRLISDCYRLGSQSLFDARAEFDFLLEKIEKKAGNKKSHENIQHDALSLAFITQLSVEASKKGEKIVFVTGDKTLFECYSDWFYHHNERSVSSGLPFVARRVSQYTPILNISSARSDISINAQGEVSTKAQEIFDSLEEIVLAVSMPITARMSVSWEDDFDSADRYYWKSWFCRSRAQKGLGLSFPDRTSAVLNSTKNELTFLQKRASILFSEYMMKRLDEKHRAAVTITGGSAIFDGMQQYVKKRIGRLHRDVEFLIKISDKKNILLLYGLNRSGLHRLPDTIMYKVGGRRGFTISEIIKNLESGKEYRNLLNTLDFVDMRAFGAAVALTAYSWSEGKFYALRALELARQKHDADPSAYSELVFLATVAERYCLADALWANYDASVASRELRRLRNSLDEIERYVGKRGLSEKAALHLFVFQCGIRHLIEQGGDLVFLRESVRLLLEASRANKSDSTGAADDQVRHNIASVFLLAALIIGVSSGEHQREPMDDAVGILETVPFRLVQASLQLAEEAVDRDVSKFLKLESAFFLSLFDPSESQLLKVSALLDEIKPAENLGMDVYVAKKIGWLLGERELFSRVQAAIERIYASDVG